MRKTPKVKPDRCQESALPQGPGLVLDKVAGVLSNAKFLGWESRNNRTYKRSAVDEAIKRPTHGYEGAWVYLDHSDQPASDLRPPKRSVKDKFAKLFNVRTQDDGGFCDLKYNTGHPFARAFEWFVENDPAAIGLSHDALLAGPYLKDGTRVIEAIPKVFSVDLVCDPASVKSLQESMDSDLPDTNNDPTMDLEDETSNAHEESLCDAIVELVRDKKLDPSVRKSKIQAIVKMLLDDGEAEEQEPEESETPVTDTEKDKALEALNTEVKELKVQLGVFRAKEAKDQLTKEARAKCKAAGLPDKIADDTFIGLMVDRGQESFDATITWAKGLLSETPTSTGHNPPAKATTDSFVADFRKSK